MDLAFDLTVVPGHPQGRERCGLIADEVGRKAGQSSFPRGFNPIGPAVESRDRTMRKNSRAVLLDAAQQQMLDCAEADRAQFQSVFEGLFDFVEREGLK